MSLFAIADTHLSLSTDKAMDIFSGWDNYVQRLEKNWNETVTPDDTVVIAGDISWGINLGEALADFQFLHNLNGHKILLKGNHDYWFSTKNRVDTFFAENELTSLSMLFNNSFVYEDYVICGTRGWIDEKGKKNIDKKVLLREAGRLKLSIEHGLKTGKEPIVFLHYPPLYYIHDCKEILDVLVEYGIKTCYYGHIHGNDGFQFAIDGVVDGIDYHLVSCDYVGFCPVKVV